MQHDMPKSLLVLAVSFTPETRNLGTCTPLEGFLVFGFQVCIMYMHIFKL